MSDYCAGMEYDPRAANEPLIAEIGAFCAEHGTSASTFGQQAIGDRNLVADLKDGRQLRGGTIFKIRQYLDGHAPAREAAE